MKKSVAASEKPVKAKEFDKELFKRSVEYNVRTLYRKNLEEADAFLEDSMAVVSHLLQEYGNDVYVSIMNQYTPMESLEGYPELKRRVTDREYNKVIDFALDAGLENGFVQEGDTAKESFIPDFSYEGV